MSIRKVKLSKEIFSTEDLKNVCYEGFTHNVDNNTFTCNVTGLDLGFPIDKLDFTGHIIFSKHVLIDSQDYPMINTIDISQTGHRLTYGTSNHLCGHLPIDNHAMKIIGVLDDNENCVMCVK